MCPRKDKMARMACAEEAKESVVRSCRALETIVGASDSPEWHGENLSLVTDGMIPLIF